MACMCGDICCSSCGPAQGNTRCPICRAWVSDCCEHYDEETGELKAEFLPALNAAIEAENAATDAMYQDYLQDEKLRKEYWGGEVDHE